MKKHLQWLLPLAAVPALYAAAGFTSHMAFISGMSEMPKALLMLCIFGVWLIASIILLVKSVQKGYRIFRSHRRSGGHFTKSEKAQADIQQMYETSWSAARALTSELGRGRTPAAMEVWGIVLNREESVHLLINADYARYYGLNGSYVHTSGFFWGRPAFVLAGVGMTALANRSRRRAAEAASRQQWRENQRTQMFLTNHRIICQVNGRWLSFAYSQVSACYPEPENNSMVLEFHSSEPLLIGGPEAPLAIAYLVWALYGEHGLAAHPALNSLRS